MVWPYLIIPQKCYNTRPDPVIFIKKADKLLEAEIPGEAQDRFRFNAALLKEMISSGFNKKELLSSFKLAFQFNETDRYKLEDFEGWDGKVLVITAEDDPYFKDAEDLIKNLPHTRLYTFPKGTGHLAPLIDPGTFFGLIEEFLESGPYSVHDRISKTV
jgi:pimeloyl-ACP methyl ester carboxylesterase